MGFIKTMVGKTKHINKSDRERFRSLKEHGCEVCRSMGFGWVFAECHHILSGGRRLGHSCTIPLCPWHHQGHPPEGYDERSAKHVFGPSLKLHKREFVDRFGSELEILDRVNQILGVVKN